jgi:hypothetical protein
MNLPPLNVCRRIRQLFALLGLPDAKEFARNLAKLIKLLTAHELTWNDLPELLAATGPQPHHASPASLAARAANKAAWKIRHHIYRLFGQLSASANAAYAHDKLIKYLTKHGLVWTDLPAILTEPDASAKAWSPPQAQPSPVMRPDGTQVNVLELVLHLLELHVACTVPQRMAAALWVLHTYVFGRFRYTPRLAVLSPVRRCGKSRLLRLLEQLCADPNRTDSISAAAFYRALAAREHSMLVDEGDNLGLFNNHDLRTVFNAGYERGAAISRVIDGRERKICLFAPLAVAAIGTLPLPLMDRAITINMQRAAVNVCCSRSMSTIPYFRRRVRKFRSGQRIACLTPTLKYHQSWTPARPTFHACCSRSPMTWGMAKRRARRRSRSAPIARTRTPSSPCSPISAACARRRAAIASRVPC